MPILLHFVCKEAGWMDGLDTTATEQKAFPKKMMGNMPAFLPCVHEFRIYRKINSNADILEEKSRVDVSQT